MPTMAEAERTAAVAFRIAACDCTGEYVDRQGALHVHTITCAKNVAKRAVLTNAMHPHRIEKFSRHAAGVEPIGVQPYPTPAAARAAFATAIRHTPPLVNVVRLFCCGELVTEYAPTNRLY